MERSTFQELRPSLCRSIAETQAIIARTWYSIEESLRLLTPTEVEVGAVGAEAPSEKTVKDLNRDQ